MVSMYQNGCFNHINIISVQFRPMSLIQGGGRSQDTDHLKPQSV